MASQIGELTEVRPQEVSKDAAVHFFTLLDRDRDLYITEADLHWFVGKYRLSLKPHVLAGMFKEATTSTSPSGKLRLVDVRQAAGFRRERQRMADVRPDASTGQKAAVKWMYRSRPNRSHWVFLISTAAGDSSIFVPPLFPTPSSPTSRSGTTPSSRPSSRTQKKRTVVKDFDAGVAVARNFMIHGARDSVEDRMATIADSVASVGASTKAGVLRRQALETSMNRFLTGADEDLWRGSTPTPSGADSPTTKSFSFDASRSFADANSQLEVDSVGEQIRLVADRTAEFRARASTPIGELGSGRLTAMPAAKLSATKKRMVKEASFNGDFVVAPIPKPRIPVTVTSDLSRRPARRTVGGNLVDGESSSDDEGNTSDDSDAVPSDAVAVATDMYRGTNPALSPLGSDFGGMMSFDGADTEVSSIVTMSLPGSPVGGAAFGSSASLFGGHSKSTLFPPGSVKSGSARALSMGGGGGGSGPGSSSPLTLSTVFAKSKSVTGTIPGLEGSRDEALSLQTSKSAIMLGGSRNRHQAKRISKLVQRRAKTLTKHMRRLGKPGGVAAIKSGLDPTVSNGNSPPAIAVSDKDMVASNGASKPFRVSTKPRSRHALLTEEALQRRAGTDKWKPHTGPSFRPKFVPPVNKEFEDPFGLLSRLMTNKERVAELDMIKKEGIANYRGPDARYAELALKKDRPTDFHVTYAHPKSRPWEMPRPATTDGTSTRRA